MLMHKFYKIKPEAAPRCFCRKLLIRMTQAWEILNLLSLALIMHFPSEHFTVIPNLQTLRKLRHHTLPSEAFAKLVKGAKARMKSE